MEVYNSIFSKLVTRNFEIYILYFDEAIGHVPLLIYPKESFKSDPKKMRRVKFHPIWFLDITEKGVSDHINLIYEGNVCYAKKFFTISKRKKRRAGLKDDTPETIIIIITLPTSIYPYGIKFLDLITENIIENFKHKFYQIIESEIAKDEIIKTAEINDIIKNGDLLKDELRSLINKTSKEYLLKIII